MYCIERESWERQQQDEEKNVNQNLASIKATDWDHLFFVYLNSSFSFIHHAQHTGDHKTGLMRKHKTIESLSLIFLYVFYYMSTPWGIKICIIQLIKNKPEIVLFGLAMARL